MYIRTCLLLFCFCKAVFCFVQSLDELVDTRVLCALVNSFIPNTFATEILLNDRCNNYCCYHVHVYVTISLICSILVCKATWKMLDVKSKVYILNWLHVLVHAGGCHLDTTD